MSEFPTLRRATSVMAFAIFFSFGMLPTLTGTAAEAAVEPLPEPALADIDFGFVPPTDQIPGQDGRVRSGPANACLAAGAQARSDTKSGKWFLIGLFLSGFGVLSALGSKAIPEGSLLAGKDADYVEAYQKCYQKTARGERLLTSAAGCSTGIVVGYAAAYIWFVNALSRAGG